jgi:hypothetical protein
MVVGWVKPTDVIVWLPVDFIPTATSTRSRKEPPMPSADFQHLPLSMVNDVAVVEIRTKDVQGTKAGPGARRRASPGDGP